MKKGLGKDNMEKIIIANWKSYISLEKSISILESIDKSRNLIVAPSIANLSYLVKKFPKIAFASQDISSISDTLGAFTGETPIELIKELGVRYTMIGHSERRVNNFDDLQTIKQKLSYASKHNVIPIYCIGESIDDRKEDKYRETIELEIEHSFSQIADFQNLDQIIIAYEPFWSIGTGLIPTEKEIKEMADIIKSKVNFVDKKINLVYGGSVNTDNAENILAIDDIDGLLIGGASTDEKKLNTIINII